MKRIPSCIFYLFIFFSANLAAQQSEEIVQSQAPIREILAGTDSISLEKFILWHSILDTMVWRYHRHNATMNINRFSDASTLDFRLSAQEKLEQQIDRDYVGARLSQDQLDRPALLNITGLTRFGANALRNYKNRPRNVSELPIPSQMEMDILNIIWENEHATGREIYEGLDSTQLLTFLQLRENLQQMSKTGFLSEKIISPQNPFTFMTPLGDYSFEMSPKNKRNREYEYRPLVARQDMFNYLSSRLYLLNGEASPPQSEVEKLHELLLRMISSSQTSHLLP